MSHLEPSDHLHLGQMITFAAGLDVSAVVWITTRIGEEHRAVLDWLNQHGDDEVRFFGSSCACCASAARPAPPSTSRPAPTTGRR